MSKIQMYYYNDGSTLHILSQVLVLVYTHKKAQFALSAKITALHNQLAFEGKGVRVKSVVILQGALNT